MRAVAAAMDIPVCAAPRPCRRRCAERALAGGPACAARRRRHADVRAAADSARRSLLSAGAGRLRCLSVGCGRVTASCLLGRCTRVGASWPCRWPRPSACAALSTGYGTPAPRGVRSRLCPHAAKHGRTVASSSVGRDNCTQAGRGATYRPHDSCGRILSTGAVLDASRSFSAPLPSQKLIAEQCFRFFNSETYYRHNEARRAPTAAASRLPADRLSAGRHAAPCHPG